MFSKDNPDFYPTPEEVIQKMKKGLSVSGKTVLDPESGKGDILKYCKSYGAKTLGCEINPDLYNISKEYARMIGTDFLLVERIDLTTVEIILMNPPFSSDIEHILHAWKIAPNGCEIRALCNMSTLRRDISKSRQLVGIIADFNGSIEDLGDCFTDAERKTNVNVALVSLTKPAVEEEDWSAYFDYELNDTEHYAPGLAKHDVVVEVVGRYVGALKMFNEVDNQSRKINELMGPINMKSISFGCSYRDKNNNIQSLNFKEFRIELQKSAWERIFSKMNMEKYMTASLKERISKFIEQQSETPFTVANIYNMLQFIHDSNAGRMDEVLIQVFESLTKHYDDNRYHLEGWKTNSHYMINEKMIVPYMVQERDKKTYSLSYNGNVDKIDDLTKALCYLTGIDYNEIGRLDHWVSHVKITDEDYYRNSIDIKLKAGNLYSRYASDWSIKEKFLIRNPNMGDFVQAEIERAVKACPDYERREWGVWYDWGFFKVKAFKKGTMHFTFKERKIWELFNRKVAEAKGFELPEKI